jgi:hypothetical protein
MHVTNIMTHAYVIIFILNFISHHKVCALRQDEKPIHVTSHAKKNCLKPWVRHIRTNIKQSGI